MSKKSWEQTRHGAREFAFQVLYSLSFSPAGTPSELEHAFLNCPNHDEIAPDGPKGFAWDLVKGVWENSDLLDQKIQKFSPHWRIERMGKIELTILRMAAFELTTNTTPPKVVLDEAVELTKCFATQEAAVFVNAVLNAINRQIEKG